MSDKTSESWPNEPEAEDLEARDRREFLVSLGKWSKAVIGGVLLGGVLVPDQEAEAGGWDSGGGSGGIWYNSGHWGGWGGWINRPGDWYDGPIWNNRPHWHNRPRWYNRPHWHDRWYNRHGRNRPWYNGRRWDDWYNRRY